jgi:hypothetical protein
VNRAVVEDAWDGGVRFPYLRSVGGSEASAPPSATGSPTARHHAPLPAGPTYEPSLPLVVTRRCAKPYVRSAPRALGPKAFATRPTSSLRSSAGRFATAYGTRTSGGD